ncbi:hypothetical protein EV646_12026 [Kribbella antiqua]|uniref:Uncharacterized protein n=1 Tax=Kribbella antiqua TaxID=2512217 RepID=A0A4R2I415_9ACTN|nr:hypothetical protein [Kribbella antiqua]TCO38652.1 hypothetical protein EV646_12026 [Kribbella antiqua]
MITEHQEIARYKVAEQLRAADARALRKGPRADRVGGPRHELAVVLRKMADRLEPQPRHRRTGLSVVR